MAERVKNSNLEAVCRRINRIVNQSDNQEVWTTLHDLEEAPFRRANIGVYYIDGAYGGVALYRVTSEGGGVTDVFSVGHVPKRELYHLMFAYIEGLCTGMRTAERAAETVA